MKKITLLICILIPALCLAEVPNTFTSDTKASAAEVNANFTNLDGRQAANDTIVSRLFSNIYYRASVATGPSGIAPATCRANTIAIAASCSCTGNGTVENFGVLFACKITSDGAIAGCSPNHLYDPELPLSPVDIAATCVGAVRVDGTEAVANTSDKAVFAKETGIEETTEEAFVRLQNLLSSQINALNLKATTSSNDGS